MEKDIGLYELIFAYFESQILFGYHRYGDRLPSISQICETFQVGRNTVRLAFRRLNEKGYIQSEERKASVVVYKGTPEEFEKNRAQYFVPRQDGIRDFSGAAKLLFLPALDKRTRKTAGLEDAVSCQKKHERLINEAPPVVRFGVYTLAPLKNELLLNLYWECMRYVSFLYYDYKKEDYDLMAKEFPQGLVLQLEDGIYSVKRQEVLRFAESACKKYHLEATKPIPFKWNIYRQRPQLKYSLAAQIISSIFWGDYPIGSFLPSLSNIAQRYGVSLMTVRRTLALLNTLGVTQSYRGSGTKICMDAIPSTIPSPDIQEDLRLHRESLQLLAMTIRGVMMYTLKAVSEDRKTQLIQELSLVRERKQGFLCFGVILNFICENCPSAMVRECYGRLKEFIVWGCIIALPMLKSEQFNTMHNDGIQRMETHLENGDEKAFARDCQTLMLAHLKNNSKNIGTFADDWRSMSDHTEMNLKL